MKQTEPYHIDVDMLFNQIMEEKIENNNTNLTKRLDEFDFTEYDRIFTSTGINKNDCNTKVKVDKKEIEKIFSEYEKKIDEEIHKELKSSYNPTDHISKADKERVTQLLREDDLIKSAVDNNLITNEEVVMFLDYYEIFARMNKTKRETLQALNTITEICATTEEDPFVKLQQEIEQKLNVTESILTKRPDMSMFEYDYKEPENPFVTEKKLINKTFTSFEEKLPSERNTLRISIDSNRKKTQIPVNNNNSNKIELFNDRNQITNLTKVRNERKNLIKQFKGNKINSRPELFKFEFSKPQLEDEKRRKFFEMMEMQNFIKNENTSTRKNKVRQKIEEALNYSKSKNN